MITALTITKYRLTAIPFAFLGMAVLRLPMWLNKKCRFWKLMGSGKNAQVDLAPNFKHWAILTNWDNITDCQNFYENSFAIKWFRLFKKEEFTVFLKPLASHGLWSGEQPFYTDKDQAKTNGRIAVITRAAIRLNRVKEFQQNIKKAADAMRVAPGFIIAAGIGEAPFFRQATFSIWEDSESMKNYAYKTMDHANVIKLTRERKWYSEELFARFEILEISGSLNGIKIKNQENNS
ncbi:DUF3291 domain-containing protein [Pedobacter nototheniae]|uniref:DUF3291 domain-containing protein n=1 Tax=Pedobacter nototheniae TaxID=2488994 RepID=UPI00103A418E|nr:DUF3291 domain-containing protein [Pedobacter nototheniae]